MIDVGEDEDLPDVSDSLFSVCPWGGCEASLREDERTVFREVHEDLVTARTLETRSFCSPTSAAMVLSCIWQAEIHCCGLQCPQASLGHGHVSIGAAEWPQRPRLPLCL